MSIKLSDAQLVLLSAASQRADHCLVAPQHLNGAAAKKVAEKLIGAELVREIRAKGNAPVWRRDEEEGIGYALKLTAAGVKAIAVEDDVAEVENGVLTSEPSIPDSRAKPRSPVRSAGVAANSPNGAADKAQTPGADRHDVRAPRDGSKLATVIGLLRREGGATLDDLVAATGWLPHTMRAALTGLRQRGCGVSREKAADGQASIYRLAEVPLEDLHTTGAAPDIDPAEGGVGETAARPAILSSEEPPQSQPSVGRPKRDRREGRREESQSGRPARRRAA